MSRFEAVLRKAWEVRQGKLNGLGAVRIFHGPSEGGSDLDASRIAIELFSSSNAGAPGKYAWVFSWENHGKSGLSGKRKEELAAFLSSIGVLGAVELVRPEKGVPNDAEVFFGEVPEFLDIEERGRRFRIRFEGTKHPGLFLDHLPLRDWLEAGGVRGKSVLNAFAYTGSLSVAAKRGGAKRVVTLDLSRPTIGWAKENWMANFGEPNPSDSDFIYGDVFEWLPKLKRRGERMDCVILDPPSFSRSPKKVFSTAKDLEALHILALDLIAPKGVLITSINSARISSEEFLEEVFRAADRVGRRCRPLLQLGAPSETFPGGDRLKGWVISVDPDQS